MTSEPVEPGPPAAPAPPPKPKSRWRLIAPLIVAVLCGYTLVRHGLDFIRNGKRPAQIGREVRAKLAPGMTLREALVLSNAAGRNEPETAMGNPLAFIWAHCTSAPRSATGAANPLGPGSTRVYLFVAARGSASPQPASPKGGLPPTVFMDQPEGSPIDTEAAVTSLSKCRNVEIVFESGFWGWIYLPLLVTPDGHLETIGEIYTQAK
jgi:hypothetical protein